MPSPIETQRRLLDLSHYDTDKIANRYLELYHRELRELADNAVLLELGVKNGGSLALWQDYFPNGIVAGIDTNLANVNLPDDRLQRLQLFEGRQEDTAFLSRVAKQVAPQGFDLIIDDASHVAQWTRPGFWHLFDNHLKAGGIYVIEDWTTGFWDDWRDGRSFRPRPLWRQLLLKLAQRFRLGKQIPSDTHRYGMVGFIKELIDEQGASDLLRRLHARPHGRQSRFARVVVYPSVVFVHKSS